MYLGGCSLILGPRVSKKLLTDTEMKARLKELENENLLLKVGKLAAEKFATELGGYIKEDREHYTQLIQKTNDNVAKYSRRLGQLETAIKHRQLPAPDRDATTDDDDELDDATSIEAEFSEGPPPTTEHPL